MAARKNQSLINLLPQEEFAGSTAGRILVWAMSTFRYIVIGTEMVVMIAFLSRFWLDARNVDLNDLIKQKVAVLTAYSGFEKDFRDTQKRLKIFSVLSGEEKTPSLYLNAITTSLPNDIRLINLTGNVTAYQIRATSYSELSIAQYIVNLEKNGSFEKVSISNLDSSQQDSGIITFNLKLTPKGGGI
jgi:Tfp pilus assembly protein PilN